MDRAREQNGVPSRAAVPRQHLIVVANLKGGTGKSTVSVNVACGLAERERRVMIIDNDPQGTAAAWASRGGLQVECIHRPLESFAQAASWINGVRAVRRDFDITLVDLPASVAPALGASFMMASVILIPSSPNEIDLVATRRILAHVARARQERPQQPPAVLLVPTRVVDLERGLETFMSRLAKLGEEVAPPLRHAVAFDQAFAQGQWIGTFRPNSAAHAEVRALVDVILRRLERLELGVSPAAAAAPEIGKPAAAPHGRHAPRPEQRGWLGRLFGGGGRSA